MFTGIIEALGQVQKIEEQGSNRSFWISAPISPELKPDQSVAHDGICLTVEELLHQAYKVTAIAETLEKTTAKNWGLHRQINLERSLLPTQRLDGHFVQGHIDTTGICEQIEDRHGSWQLTITFPREFCALVIEKGSIAINGISLTLFEVGDDSFRVAIIPYTWEHTNLQSLRAGDHVNLEFDMLGKYICETS